jgi:triphosphoribosyl-dephospho-CoA synthase
MDVTKREWAGQAAQLACVFEALAEKPGNVTRFRDCARLTFEQFMVSAIAVGPAFSADPSSRVGEIILRAATATRRLAGVNTNIGIILLLAPLLRAAVAGEDDLRSSLRRVLRDLDMRDAHLAFRAILTAAPEGLDTVAQGDIRTMPELTLREAMGMAADRDSLAAEYVTDFRIVFEIGLPCLNHLWDDGRRFSEAVIQTYLTILAEVPDTDIARKLNRREAARVAARAAAALDLGGVFTEAGGREIALLDAELRDEQRRYNPGATADLIAATIFVFLLSGTGPEGVPALLGRW